MNETPFCGNSDVLMSYLYDEGDEHERRAFEIHLRTCEACARDVAGLRSVRGDLAAWTPPEAVLDFRIVRDPAPKRRFAWLAVPELPVWAQFAAATLVVGIAVGLSGLEVIYNPTDGLTFQEIAELQGCPLSTVKTRLYQGLSVLRRELERRGAGPARPEGSGQP